MYKLIYLPTAQFVRLPKDSRLSLPVNGEFVNRAEAEAAKPLCVYSAHSDKGGPPFFSMYAGNARQLYKTVPNHLLEIIEV